MRGAPGWPRLPHDHDDDLAGGTLRDRRGLRELPTRVSALRVRRLRGVPDDQPGRLHLDRRVPDPTVGAPRDSGSTHPLDGLTACGAISSLIRATRRGSVFGVVSPRSNSATAPNAFCAPLA